MFKIAPRVQRTNFVSATGGNRRCIPQTEQSGYHGGPAATAALLARSLSID